ncbi:MAG: MBL fold metallo-hydrolase, partial [Alphaproteobacteria bacterium]|nr:MBL fold metallo-hydrolase [Alphaproteobacteria bacterium]
ADLLPDIKGLKQKTDDLLGILISHPHQDHYGLGLHIDKSIPIYMGEATAKIMNVCVQHNLPSAFAFANIHIFESYKPFNISTFKITPYLVDHSAYGAHAFLIEADGRRLFYSGDFRAHGRKGKLFDYLIKNPPKDIDVLMMEGSCLGRELSEKYPSEQSLQAEFEKVFKQTKGAVFIQSSSQNIDRVVTIYRAAKKNGRTLVMSGYTGHILMALNNPHLPSFKWPDVKKFATDSTMPHHITKEMIEKNPNKYVIMLGGPIFNILKNGSLINENTSFIYSMWEGYKELYQERLSLMKEKQVPMFDIHTSGHADIPTLKQFAAALKPKKIVPIHTFFPEQFKEMFDNTELHKDNEIFEI